MIQLEAISPIFSPEKFKFLQADALIRDKSLVPECERGVYALFLRGGKGLLDATGYFKLGGQPPARIGDFVHLYTGSSYELQQRLKNHLLGDVRTSTLRKTLLAIDMCCREHGHEIIGCRNAWNESLLSDWLAENALVAIQICADPIVLEKDLLSRTPSPLNITQRRASAYAQRLIVLRCMFEDRAIPGCCANAAHEWLQ